MRARVLRMIIIVHTVYVCVVILFIRFAYAYNTRIERNRRRQEEPPAVVILKCIDIEITMEIYLQFEFFFFLFYRQVFCSRSNRLLVGTAAHPYDVFFSILFLYFFFRRYVIIVMLFHTSIRIRYRAQCNARATAAHNRRTRHAAYASSVLINNVTCYTPPRLHPSIISIIIASRSRIFFSTLMCVCVYVCIGIFPPM